MIIEIKTLIVKNRDIKFVKLTATLFSPKLALALR